MKTIGFIGCGNMAQPIIRNVAEKNVFNKNDIFVYDIDREKLSSFCKKTEINVAESEAQIASECDVVVLCTKPQVFPELLPAIADELKKNNPLVVSIAAGKTTEYISSVLDYDAPVARIFPNLNAQVGEAISAYTGNKSVSEEQLAKVGEICSSFGEAKYMDESRFSVFGVLGGCVPAYAFMFIGALAKAGVADGLDENDARDVAVQAVLGSAKLLKECGGDIEEWVKKVCSPGGTTIQGVTSLRESDIDAVVKTAFHKSYMRDIELSGTN
ncbi:MAG: pyrroline-5-carboxylate reductase [Clostridia bacterium]|nr:pyrroline-5-carboxylate reductase [Clostridia bacterium]